MAIERDEEFEPCGSALARADITEWMRNDNEMTDARRRWVSDRRQQKLNRGHWRSGNKWSPLHGVPFRMNSYKSGKATRPFDWSDVYKYSLDKGCIEAD